MNKFMGLIGVVLLVVGVAMMFTLLNKVHELTGGSFLTGAVTSSTTGQTNVTVTATTSITIGSQQINFGSGYVNKSCDYCVMTSRASENMSIYSNGSNIEHLNCCVGFNLPMTGFLIENTGNVNVSVGYTCSGNCTHSSFIGGNRASSMAGLEFRVIDNYQMSQLGEQGGLDTSRSCFGGGAYDRHTRWNITNETSYTNSAFSAINRYFPLSPAGHWICGNYTHSPLSAINTEDAGVFDVNVTVPADAIGTGVRSSFTLTFNATSQ